MLIDRQKNEQMKNPKSRQIEIMETNEHTKTYKQTKRQTEK